MDPFSVRVLTGLVFTLCLGSLMGCLGYLWAATRSSRREAAGIEWTDEDAAATAGRGASTDGGVVSGDSGGFVFGEERDDSGRGDPGDSGGDDEREN